mmetsp:Transcript_7141/g.20227  ORF Transcript_7141/g.20227 Transcript_7141/m.20227 type:complete len:377 (-) Transcript_7141:196-1326(-)
MPWAAPHPSTRTSRRSRPRVVVPLERACSRATLLCGTTREVAGLAIGNAFGELNRKTMRRARRGSRSKIFAPVSTSLAVMDKRRCTQQPPGAHATLGINRRHSVATPAGRRTARLAGQDMQRDSQGALLVMNTVERKRRRAPTPKRIGVSWRGHINALLTRPSPLAKLRIESHACNKLISVKEVRSCAASPLPLAHSHHTEFRRQRPLKPARPLHRPQPPPLGLSSALSQVGSATPSHRGHAPTLRALVVRPSHTEATAIGVSGLRWQRCDRGVSARLKFGRHARPFPRSYAGDFLLTPPDDRGRAARRCHDVMLSRTAQAHAHRQCQATLIYCGYWWQRKEQPLGRICMEHGRGIAAIVELGGGGGACTLKQCHH